MALQEPDELYAELVAMHEGLAPAQSLELCARLILLLANEVGDTTRVRQLMREAARSAEVASTGR